MKQILLALASGVLFGGGLELSHMTNPAKVQNFLDLAGSWDPSLACVMGAALFVSSGGTWIARGRAHPWLADAFAWPTRHDLDARLLGGAALFGAGWGLAGFCPGPALANLQRVDADIAVFVAAMLGGLALYHIGFVRLVPTRPAASAGRPTGPARAAQTDGQA